MPYVGPAPTPNAPKDLQGGELKLDADADTSITADTDDTIHFKIAGADDFTFTANTFTAESGSTIAAQALTATTFNATGATTAADITASGIIKTDDTTEATSTTDGSLQTDGGLSVVKDTVMGDDLKLISDASVIHFGNDLDVTLTHVADTGLLLNSTMQLQFNDSSQYINAPSNAILDINATDEIELNATLIDINGNLDVSGTVTLADGSLAIADLDIDGGTDIGEAIVDADLFIVDNGAGGTNRKTTASRLKTYIGSISQAVQSDIEGETNQDTYVPPDLIKHSPGVAKAWMLFEQVGTHSIMASYNITSVTDSGSTGHSDIVIATDFSSANYCIAGTAGRGSDGDTPRAIGPQISDPLAGSLTITTTGDDGSRLDSEFCSLAFFGDQ